MQGGGAYIEGSANFEACKIYDNEADYVRARILNPVDPSSSAPLNSDTLRCFDTQAASARIWTLLEPSSSAPSNSDTLRCFDTQGYGVRARF